MDATVRLIRNDVWVSPSRHDALPRGKRWIHSTLEGKITPAGFVQLLEDIGDVEDRGEVTAAGTRCTRYRGSVDVATLLDRVGPGVAEQARISHDRFPRVPAEACVAADGTPKLLVIAQTEPGNGLRLEAEFLGFGREVDVRPPAPSQVVEASKLSG